MSMPERIIFGDTETTGFAYPRSDLVSVSLVDHGGNVLLDTLCHPGHRIPVEASRIHGITDGHVRNAPPAREVRQQAIELMAGATVVFYNASFDCRFFPGLRDVANVVCGMTAYKTWLREQGRGGAPAKLADAAAEAGHDWGTGKAHSALVDTLALRSVWLFLQAQKQQALTADDARDAASRAAPPASAEDAMAARRQRNLEAGRPARAGMPWTDEEDRRLLDNVGTPLEDLCTAFERTPRAILVRLASHGVLPGWEPNAATGTLATCARSEHDRAVEDALLAQVYREVCERREVVNAACR